MNDENKTEKQKLWQLCQNYQSLPYTGARVAVILDALAIAERIKDPRYQIDIRYDLAWSYALGDDPAKALPVCAEFFALLEEHPNPSSDRITAPSAAMIAAYVAISLPQIPLEQCKALLELFHQQVKRYGIGERLWQMHACHFSLVTGDFKEAEKHFIAFQSTNRDIMSDCAACEAGNAAECLLHLGHRAEAEAILRPVLEGNLVCESQPWSALSLLIHDDIDHGDLASAKEKGQWLAHCPFKSRTDLSYMGALLRIQAYTQPEQAIKLLEKHLPWSIDLWDQGILFHFYRGAWTLCAELEKKGAPVSLHLPLSFPLYQEDSFYDCGTLADWFYKQAQSISQAFDKRNGSDYYQKQLTPCSPVA